ncbi:MAG: carbohydrate binding domain-containing protein [Lentisphaerota bacterium]
MKNFIVCVLNFMTFGTLLAGNLQITSENPWQETVDNGMKCYTLDYSGQERSGLSFSMPVKPGGYYMVSWKMKGSVQEDIAPFGIELNMNGKTETANYVLTKDWNDYVFYFYSEDSTEAKLRLRLNPGKSKTITIKDVKADAVTDKQFTQNLIPDSNFENASGIPANWSRTNDSTVNPSRIVALPGFISGEKSLEVNFVKQPAGQCGFKSIHLPVVPGKDYEFSLWAKSEQPHTLSVSMDIIGFTRKIGATHFYKRELLKVTPEWKAYSFKTTAIPMDIVKYPDLQNRMLIIHIRWEDKTQDGKVWFDDMEFKQIEQK